MKLPTIPADFDSTPFKARVWEMTDLEFYNAYEDTFEKAGYFDYTSTVFKDFKYWLDGDFLEVGCSGGKTLRMVRKFPCVKRCVGVDVSLNALAKALPIRKKGVELYWADVEKGLPFPDRSFDTVLCGHLFEHLRDPGKAAYEILRVSRGNNIIIIPLQTRESGDKKTNLHLHFWSSIGAFEQFWGCKAEETIVRFEDTLGIMRFWNGGVS